MSTSARIGVDVGSTTVKVVLLDGTDALLFKRYRRHRSDVRGELSRLLRELRDEYPDLTAPLVVTGSAGLGLSERLDLPFVQEVMAGTKAIRRFHRDIDVVIELGGEDAKITFLTPAVSQRMNGTCAGGTGAFIDQMASLLMTNAQGLDRLAEEYHTLYTIASRCGVFAKSDLQPLINEGVSHADLAASVFQAVVNQTIAGLACGQPIEGRVAFLGGPLHYLGSLREAFRRTLQDKVTDFITPDHSDVFVAIGAALHASGEALPLSELIDRLDNNFALAADIPRHQALFTSAEDKETFLSRHARHTAAKADIAQTSGPCFLGLDAGSTTIKAALTDDQGRLIHSYYAPNQGSPIHAAIEMLRELYGRLPHNAYIARVCCTGYGDLLLRRALNADMGEIETLAHVKAAQAFAPDVDFILDIGGQDMKCMRVHDGVIDSILLNEACSSGCGSFLSTFAQSLGLTPAAFAQSALDARSPVDLGTRCTVFMNSRVKQAQKEGAAVGDISAGLSFSVVRNALYKVIRMKNPDELGQTLFVQGGTFYSDAVLRCFELITGRDVVRPDIAGLMGAYGAAILARSAWTGGHSSLLPYERLEEALPLTTRSAQCKGCENACKITVSTFSGGRRLTSGLRCDRGSRLADGEPDAVVKALPNLYEYKEKRLFDYESLPPEQAPRGVIGLPRALNMFENYPFWHTLLTRLGFSVRLSRPSDHALFENGMSTIPSESVCYPAKLAHGHIVDLIESGVTTIFYPCVPYERKENPEAGNHYNCPIVTSYPEVIKANMDLLSQRGVTFLHPFLSLQNRKVLPGLLAKAFAAYRVGRAEAKQAVDAAFAEMDRFQADLRQKGQEAMEHLREHGGVGIVLAGRPYHVDREVHHGLPGLLTSLGFAVLTEDSVSHLARAARPLRVFDQWMYHTRLYDAAAFVATQDNLELVQLNSFGCGLDAITSDQVRDILETGGKISTLLKIDEINNLGAARIRLRSLKVAMEERARRKKRVAAPPPPDKRVEFTAAMREQHTILAPQMSPIHFELVETVLQKGGYRCIVLPEVTSHDVEVGLKYVNNDACYPSLVVVGQLMAAMLSGQYDPDNTSIFLTQTGGACRATNYVALMRRALREAGMPQVPVVSLSMAGLEKNEGMRYTVPFLRDAVRALVTGDLMMQVLLRVRPYELETGAADKLYRVWMDKARAFYRGESELSYKKLLRGIVNAFDHLPLRDIPRKPRIGLVGEILVKYHPDANNHVVDVIEKEGCEAVVPGMLGFIQYCCINEVIRHENLRTSGLRSGVMGLIIRIIDRLEAPSRQALRKSRRFSVADTIHKLAARAKSVLSLCNQCGEGWLLTAEMMELMEDGAKGIVCAQPFACLPNHVTGKGMIKELRRRFPDSNIVPIDYDPGASEVNQFNRIRLMIASALEKIS